MIWTVDGVMCNIDYKWKSEDLSTFFGRNMLELSNSNCDEERGDTEEYTELYYTQLEWNGSRDNPIEVDEKMSTVIKYGKCKKCGFGSVGVAKLMYKYLYDIMNVKKLMETKIDWSDKEFKELPPV